MKKIFIEVRESLLKKKFFTLLIFFQATILFTLLAVLFLHFNNVDTKTESYYAQYDGKSIYQLSDNLINEKEEEFFSSGDSLEILKSFYNQLKESENFIYLYTFDQPIGVSSFKGNELFQEGYEDGMVVPPYDVDGKQFETVKSIQANEAALGTFNLKVQKGTNFQNEDFTYSDGDTVPIILGAGYESLYQVGDELDIEYLFKQMKAEVVGILERNTILPIRDNMEFYTDNYIILPSFSVEYTPKIEDEEIFQRWHYLQLINGQLFTDKDNLQVRKAIDDISEETGFYDLTVIGANDLGIEFMRTMLNQNINLLVMFVSVLFFFCIASICTLFTIKWNINIKKYAVHFISGANINDIVSYMFTEISFILFISISLSFWILTFVGTMPALYYYAILAAGLVLVTLGLLPLYVRLKKLNIANMLKRKV